MNAREYLKGIWRDWANNYLTLDKMAADHHIDADDLAMLIKLGRDLHNADAELEKTKGDK